jgi:hypothetical protein
LAIGFGARTEPPDCALVPVGWLAAGAQRTGGLRDLPGFRSAARLVKRESADVPTGTPVFPS